ncbi:MAG: polymer-forming cytoskeletal protein [Gemmatimonadota bacterium]|uniref:polymer-forming cytoskeletal protein n=1 Tax=Candidatus Palauibacter scopulicola TaxID=3056741 RepID=UPI002395608B|nr:polymer-forming cytoskeletal protein [Candidatus Palauibacter scopulicola]MDE2662898.1 polymer-forming cytoskeletal protein [Candidatus Palauibacter scopulicola]
MKRYVLAAALAAGPAAGLPAPASGQEVWLAEEPRSEAQAALAAFLDAGGFAVWTRDTVLARGDTVPGAVLLLEGTARIAGRVEGDLYVVDGDLFLRSGASIAGDVLVLGGGFYDSDVAEVEGAVTYRPNEPLRVRPSRGGFEIIPEIEPEPAFELDGTLGFHLPTYDRVNGLSIPVGALARLPTDPGRPEIAGGLTWIPAREDVDYRLHSSGRFGERLRLGLFATSAVVSNEEWIRPTWYNSLAHFVAGDDVGSHYDSREIGLELEWTSPEPPVWEDAPRWRVVAALGREQAEDFRFRNVTILFGEEPPGPFPSLPDYDPHLQIDNGSLWFGRLGFEWESQGRGGHNAMGLGVEVGLEDELSHITVGLGPIPKYNFLLVEGRVSARRVLASGHAVEAFGIGRFDVSGRLPMQRYSMIGGIGTLPTMPLRGRRGPRLVYAEAAYAIPLLGDAALGGVDVFARGSGGGIDSPWDEFELYGSVQGGLALRMWDFRLEFGVAAGSTAEPGDPGLIAFVDIRTRRSARPTRMPPPR